MNQIVFITGVSSGFGYALLSWFHSHNYHVIGTVRNAEDKKRLLQTFPDKIHLLEFDVRDAFKIESEIQSIRHILHNGNLCLLVNNAGIAVPGPLECLSDDSFEMQWQVNVKSVWKITNTLLPYLKEKEPGKIINISSVSGLINTPFLGAYCISKHALESMTEIYRRELSIFGIQVVSICPGPAKTEIWRKNIGKLDPFVNSDYGRFIKHADKLIQKSELHGLPADDTVQKVWKAFSSKRPKTRYVVHKNPFSIFLISKIIPPKWLDMLIAKTMNKGEKIRPI